MAENLTYLVEQPCSNTIDEWRHNDMCLNSNLEASLNSDNICGSLTIGFQSFSRLFICIDVILVGEDAVFNIFACDRIITQVGCASSL